MTNKSCITKNLYFLLRDLNMYRTCSPISLGSLYAYLGVWECNHCKSRAMFGLLRWDSSPKSQSFLRRAWKILYICMHVCIMHMDVHMYIYTYMSIMHVYMYIFIYNAYMYMYIVCIYVYKIHITWKSVGKYIYMCVYIYFYYFSDSLTTWPWTHAAPASSSWMSARITVVHSHARLEDCILITSRPM
jgi:hypothetical protein